MADAVVPAPLIESFIKTSPVIVNPELEKFWRKLWHVDVKKDHGPQTYNIDIVNELLAVAGEDAGGGKDGLFNDLIQKPGGLEWPKAYDRFQSPTASEISNMTLEGEGGARINSIKIKYTPYTYTFQIFKREETGTVGEGWNQGFINMLSNMHEFLPKKQILRYTDTSRDGWQVLCAFPPLGVGRPHLLHANTREVESDPASKLAMSSFDLGCRANSSNVYYYEAATSTNKNLVYPKWDTAVPGRNVALSSFYCSKDVIVTLKKSNPASGKLEVELSFFDENKKIDVTEDMNKAGSFTKLLSNIKKFLNIRTAKDLKKAIFISKHHGDIGQVLSPFKPRILTKVGSAETISTDNFLSAFESYDINPILKAFSVGEDIIWMHTSPVPGSDKCIIIFVRDGVGATEEQLVVDYTNQYTIEKDKLAQHVTDYNLVVDTINAQRTNFIAYFAGCFRKYGEAAVAGVDTIAKANAWRVIIEAENNLNKRYGLILQRAAQFAVLAKNLPSTVLVKVGTGEGEINISDYEDFAPKATNKESIDALKGLITEITNKRNLLKIPLELLGHAQNVLVQGGTNAGDLQSVSIQKDIGLITDADYRSFTKKTMATMWSFINLKNVRSRLAGIEPKFITAYGLKSIKLILEGLEPLFGEAGKTLFLEFLTDSVRVDADILQRLTAGLEFIQAPLERQAALADATVAAILRGGRRTRRQKGGQGNLRTRPRYSGSTTMVEEAPRSSYLRTTQKNTSVQFPGVGRTLGPSLPVKFQIMEELLKDLRDYFNLVLDNLANPDNIEQHLNEYLKNAYGMTLQLDQKGGNIRKKTLAADLNEDFDVIANPVAPAAAAEAAAEAAAGAGGAAAVNVSPIEISADVPAEEEAPNVPAEDVAEDGTKKFTTLTPIMGHVKDIIANFCANLNSAEARSRLNPRAHNIALYNLLFVIQQFNTILNLTETSEEEEIDNILKQEIAEIKTHMGDVNYFQECTLYGTGLSNNATRRLIENLSDRALTEIAQRLVLKHTGVGGVVATAGRLLGLEAKRGIAQNRQQAAAATAAAAAATAAGDARAGAATRAATALQTAVDQATAAQAAQGADEAERNERVRAVRTAKVAANTAKGLVQPGNAEALKALLSAEGHAVADNANLQAATRAANESVAMREQLGRPWADLVGLINDNNITDKMAWIIIHGPTKTGNFPIAVKSIPKEEAVREVSAANPILTRSEVRKLLQQAGFKGNVLRNAANPDWFAEDAEGVVPANPFTAEGGARRTQRRRKNENKKRRKTKSKSKHGRVQA